MHRGLQGALAVPRRKPHVPLALMMSAPALPSLARELNLAIGSSAEELTGPMLRIGIAEQEDAAVWPDIIKDPLYEDALRIVLELGKASTSTLQRRLRLGYGRAACILDTMQRDGIIGPPDGSKTREVLKRPDWLREIEVR